MSEVLEYVKEEAEKSKQHELQLFQLLISQISSSQFQSQSHNQNFLQSYHHQKNKNKEYTAKLCCMMWKVTKKAVEMLEHIFNFHKKSITHNQNVVTFHSVVHSKVLHDSMS